MVSTSNENVQSLSSPLGMAVGPNLDNQLEPMDVSPPAVTGSHLVRDDEVPGTSGTAPAVSDSPAMQTSDDDSDSETRPQRPLTPDERYVTRIQPNQPSEFGE